MLKEIITRCSTLNIYEKRSIFDKYYEIVFYSKDTNEWNGVCSYFLGQPIKPAGAKPSKDDLLLTKDYNGIYDDQTLFKKDFGRTTIIAMFWPWQNGIFTTLKVAVLEK